MCDRNAPPRARARCPPVLRLPDDADEGSVTAEFAIVLPAVIVVAALIMALSRAVVVSMDCRDAAAAAARQVVVEAESDPAAVAADVAGSDVAVTVRRHGDDVEVTVRCPVLPGPLGILPASVTGRAMGIGR